MQISVSVIRSLLTRKLQPNSIIVTGVDLNIYQNQSQVRKIKFQLIDSINKTNCENGKHTLNYSDILSWLSKKRKLLLEDVHVTWYNNQTIAGRVLLHNLLFDNRKHQCIISGGGYVNKDISSAVNFCISFKGNFADLRNLQSALYAKIQNLNLSKWSQLLKLYGYQINRGALSGQLWVNWDQGQIKSAQSLLHAENLNFIALDHSHAVYMVPKLSGNFLWQPVQHGWKLLADHFCFGLNNVVDPENKFALIIRHDNSEAKQYFWSQSFYLENLLFLFAHNTFLPANMRNLLSHLNPSGKLMDVRFTHHGGFNQIDNYDLSANLNQIATQYWRNIPGIKNISGDLKLHSGNGSLHVVSNNSYFNFNKLLSAPIMFNKVSGHIKWSQMQDKSWWVKSDDLSLSNAESAINSHVAMLFSANKLTNPMISLLAKFDLHNSSSLSKYLPMKMFAPKLAHWLNNAFVQGDGVAGKIVLRGRVNNFPFDQHEGVFIIDSRFRNTLLHYADGWSDMNNIDANLQIKGRDLSCDLIEGRVFNSKIKNMHVAINKIGKKPAVIKLKTLIASNAPDVLRYVNNNALHKICDQITRSAKADGMVNLNFNMSLPLNKPSAVKLFGDAVLPQNTFEIPSWNLRFNELSGKILFTENKLWSQDLGAKVFNYPAKITAQFFRAANKKQQNKIILKSQIDTTTLKNNFHWLNLPFIHGKANYAAEFISLPLNSTTKTSCLLNITSDLQGITVGLPAPLAKTAQQIDPLSIRVRFGKKLRRYEARSLNIAPNFRKFTLDDAKAGVAMLPLKSNLPIVENNMPIIVKLDFDDTLSAVLQWRSKWHRPCFYNANIHFGSGQGVRQKLPGVYVDGVLPTFDWQSWRNFLYHNKELNIANNKIPLVNKVKQILREINIKIAKIVFLNKKI